MNLNINKFTPINSANDDAYLVLADKGKEVLDKKIKVSDLTSTSLPLSGGTMSGNIAMGGNEITNALLGVNASTVTQTTNISTDVTLNARNGIVTTVANPGIASGATANFEINNTEMPAIGSGRPVIVTWHFTETFTPGTDKAQLIFSQYEDGMSVVIENTGAGTLNIQIAIHFVIL